MSSTLCKHNVVIVDDVQICDKHRIKIPKVINSQRMLHKQQISYTYLTTGNTHQMQVAHVEVGVTTCCLLTLYTSKAPVHNYKEYTASFPVDET